MYSQINKISVHIVIFCTIFLTLVAEAQIAPGNKSKETRVVEYSNCEDIIGSIDRSLTVATDAGSNVIVFVKPGRKGSTSLNSARAKGLRNYFVHRGFKEFEIGVDLLANADASLEIFVGGKRLYGLPLDPRDRLDLSPCVVGIVR